jgi:hypothetical protein
MTDGADGAFGAVSVGFFATVVVVEGVDDFGAAALTGVDTTGI